MGAIDDLDDEFGRHLHDAYDPRAVTREQILRAQGRRMGRMNRGKRRNVVAETNRAADRVEHEARRIADMNEARRRGEAGAATPALHDTDQSQPLEHVASVRDQPSRNGGELECGQKETTVVGRD